MDDFKEVICEKCHKPFKLGKDLNGKWLRRRFCSDCSDYGKTEKFIYCKICGKSFKIFRSIDGRHWNYQNYTCKFCTTKQKQLFLEETKTLICEKCGKSFKVKRSPINNNFLLRKYCFNCDNTNKSYRIAKCITCGKEFKQYRTSCGGFSDTKYCSYSCSLIQRKTKICAVCGKKFELERSDITGSFKDNGKYCSDECAKIGWRKLTKITCQEKYGVDLPCQTPNCMKANPNNNSKVSDRFYDLLVSENFNIEREINVGSFTYDYHIIDTNILIELNPTFTHTSFDTGVYPPRHKNFHNDKSVCAIQHNYICLCVWDWDNWDDIIKLLKQPNLKMEYVGIKLIYSRGRETSEDKTSINEGFLPIYTDGYKVISSTIV